VNGSESAFIGVDPRLDRGCPLSVPGSQLAVPAGGLGLAGFARNDAGEEQGAVAPFRPPSSVFAGAGIMLWL